MTDDTAALEAQIEHQLAEDEEEMETVEEREARRSYYPSNNVEQPIVNAITGHPYPFNCGQFRRSPFIPGDGFHWTERRAWSSGVSVQGSSILSPTISISSHPSSMADTLGGIWTQNSSSRGPRRPTDSFHRPTSTFPLTRQRWQRFELKLQTDTPPSCSLHETAISHGKWNANV